MRSAAPTIRHLCHLVLLPLVVLACKQQPAPQQQPSSAPAALQNGDLVTVVSVVKGDEISVKKGGTTFPLRMLGIDAFRKLVMNPAMTQTNKQANLHLEKLVLNKDVKITFDTPIKDDRGRYLAYVEHNGQDINLHMVQQGFVLVYAKFAFARERAYLKAAEQAAKESKNLWANPRLVNLARERQRVWAGERKKREGSLPDYYVLGEDGGGAKGAVDSGTAGTTK